MLAFHETDNLSEYVLHELCGQDCFNVERAAYFLDNPEFDVFKGIAGYDASNRCTSCPWRDPRSFNEHVGACTFSRKVRDVKTSSLATDERRRSYAQVLSKQLDIKHPAVYTLPLKHGNCGVFIVEHNPEYHKISDEYIERGLSLMGFCPVF